MKFLGKVKRFLEEKEQYWFLFLLIFCLIEIINQTIINKYAPMWVPIVITIIITALIVCYAGYMYLFLKKKLKQYFEFKNNDICIKISNAERHIEELNKKNEELENKIHNDLKDIITASTDNILKDSEHNTSIVRSATQELMNETKLVEAQLNHMLEVHTQQAADVMKQNKDIANENKKMIAEKVSLLTEEIQKADAGLQEKNDSILTDIKTMSDSLSAFIETKTEDVLTYLHEETEMLDRHKEEALAKIAAFGKAMEEIIAVMTNNVSEKHDALIADALEKHNILVNKMDVIADENRKQYFAVLEQNRNISNEEKDLISENARMMIEELKTVNDGLSEKSDDLAAFIDTKTEEVLAYLQEETEMLDRHKDETLTKIAAFRTAIEEKNAVMAADSLERYNSLISKVEEIASEKTKQLHNDATLRFETLKGQVVSLQEDVNQNGEILLSEISKTEMQLKEAQQNVARENKIELQKNIEQAYMKIFDNQKMILEEMDKRADSLIEKITGLEGLIASQIDKVLDDVEENADRSRENNRRISRQVAEFYKKADSMIRTMKDELTENHEKIVDSQRNEVRMLSIQLEDVERANEESAKDTKYLQKQQSMVLERLDNIRIQLVNLDSLTVLLKNISERQERITAKEEKQTAKPDRIETIKDPETGMIVYNKYNDNRLVNSEMHRDGKKIYEVAYGKKGEIVSSKNYDHTGKMTTEMNYYPNGQVKERKEQIHVDGTLKTVVSKFDENGKKIN